MQQELKTDGFEVKTVSVDRVDAKTRQQNQYAYFKTTMTDRRMDVYHKCDFLTEEVLGLEKLSDGHIEHPDAGKSGSKDQIDAVVGSLWNASQHADLCTATINVANNLDAMIDVNLEQTAADRKKQMVVDFQNELSKIYQELEKSDPLFDDEETDPDLAQDLMDINEGILFLG